MCAFVRNKNIFIQNKMVNSLKLLSTIKTKRNYHNKTSAKFHIHVVVGRRFVFIFFPLSRQFQRPINWYPSSWRFGLFVARPVKIASELKRKLNVELFNFGQQTH